MKSCGYFHTSTVELKYAVPDSETHMIELLNRPVCPKKSYRNKSSWAELYVHSFLVIRRVVTERIMISISVLGQNDIK